MEIGLFGPEYLQYSTGGPVAEEPIFIFRRGTKTKAVLYQDENGLATAPNPMWTDRRGELVFFAEVGLYDLFYQHPAPNGTTVAVSIDEGVGGPPGNQILGYTHNQPTSAQTIQINHGLSFQPAGIVAIDNSGESLEYATVSYPGTGIVELTFGVDFAGIIYLS